MSEFLSASDLVERCNCSRAQNPIIFVHIFKAAGSSVQIQLREAFGQEAVRQVNDAKRFHDRLAEALNDCSVRAIAGHFSYARSGPNLPDSARLVSAVREPRLRLLSAYNYMRGEASSRWHETANRLGFGAWLEHVYETAPEIVFNHQCAQLSVDEEPTARSACANVQERFLSVVTIDRLDLLAQRIAAETGASVPTAKRLNKSRKVADFGELSAAQGALLDLCTREDARLYMDVRELLN